MITGKSESKGKKHEGTSSQPQGVTHESINVEEPDDETGCKRRETIGGDCLKFKKVEMSVFGGEDPDLWLFRADMYFQLYKVTDNEKLVTVISLEGEVLNWYRGLEEREPFKNWRGFQAPAAGTIPCDT